MRLAFALLPVLAALGALAGCGGSDGTSDAGTTSTSAAAPAATSTAPSPISTTPATTTPAAKGANKDSPYVVVTSLLGKQLPEEPACRFAKTFVPDNPSAGGYDGALALSITCAKEGDHTPTGQIVNRAGSKPTEITCRDTRDGELYCIYVPSTSVGVFFTGTDRAIVRRRLEHLIETVQPLPTGITPLSGTSTP
ncbi:MAG TPA: hypothetical protein VNA28_13940 [Solirubrobacteraceae bacterium]|nr:hypothetical protein [Solirubrobacteraceae bacterium]